MAMNIPQKICLSFVIGFIFVGTVFAVTTCKTCGPNYIACMNETYYVFCPDAKTPSKQGGFCPQGQVCTDEQQICQPKGTAKIVCGSCDTCTSGFVCRSKTQFEYCQGTTPIGIVGKCEPGQYCSLLNVVQNHNICVESCMSEPTCYAEEIIPTTTTAPKNEQAYAKSCASATTTGNYENLSDPSCKTFVKCESLNGDMYATVFNCKTGYFDATQKKCVATKPSKCT